MKLSDIEKLKNIGKYYIREVKLKEDGTLIGGPDKHIYECLCVYPDGRDNVIKYIPARNDDEALDLFTIFMGKI